MDNPKFTLKGSLATSLHFPENMISENEICKMKSIITSIKKEMIHREENAIFQKIFEVATDAGFTSVTILNETYIKRLLLRDRPTEPIEDGYFNIPMACPYCGEDIRWMVHDGHFPHYCCSCGQALKEKR